MSRSTLSASITEPAVSYGKTHSRSAVVPRLSIGHHVSAAAGEYARDKIGHALAYAPKPILDAHVRMTGHRDRSVAKPIVAQANVNLPGRVVRVQVAAETAREAIDLLQARLMGRFQRLARHWDTSGGRRGPREWRHGDAAGHRPSHRPEDDEVRRVVRHKSYALADETCDEAAFDMELMDYEFQLFTESGSGVDSVLYRTEAGDFRLAQVDPRPDDVAPAAVPFTISPAGAPLLDVGEAIERLELTRLPFVFFRDSDSGRGTLLYRRYDGDYGLITPSA